MIRRFITVVADDTDTAREMIQQLSEVMSKEEDVVIALTSDSKIKMFIAEIDDSVEKMRIVSISSKGTKVEEYKPEVRDDGWIPL
jgi:deoxyhypusine synthase